MTAQSVGVPRERRGDPLARGPYVDFRARPQPPRATAAGAGGGGVKAAVRAVSFGAGLTAPPAVGHHPAVLKRRGATFGGEAAGSARGGSVTWRLNEACVCRPG